MRALPFRDRAEAGARLAAEVAALGLEDPIVLALPRGGVPVAYEVARSLGATLDVLVVRKLGAPRQPELGVGALAPDGVVVLDGDVLESLGLERRDLREVQAREARELQRREREYRGGRPPPQLRGRDVVLVDDGIAMGGTMRAALAWARAQGPRSLVVAVPVGPPGTVESLRSEADGLVVLETPHAFRAVGLWYDRFDQTSDAEVLELLARAREFQGLPLAGSSGSPGGPRP